MITRVDFAHGLATRWQQVNVGGGNVRPTNGILRLTKPSTTSDVYTNAQVDDYQHLRRSDFLWQPPLSFTIRARFAHASLTGTAGFGFWNDPFMMTDARWPALPRAIWFFYSAPPTNMDLALDVPGYGWKVATIDAQRPLFYSLLPTAPIAIPLMHIKPLYRLLWPIAQRAINVSEAMVPQSLTTWRTYRIEWLPQSAAFFVDEHLVMQCKTPPRGPLGLVIWIDNQYMVVTPQGRVKHGFVCSEKVETLEIEWFQIDQTIKPHL